MIRREKYEPPADALNALARCLYPAMVAYSRVTRASASLLNGKPDRGMQAHQ